MVQLYARSGGEALVNTTTAGMQSNAKITRLGSGGFVVTWTDSSGTGGDSSGSAVKAQIYNAAGAKVGGEFLVNTATSGNQMVEGVAATANGGFAAVYLTENQAIRAQLFDSAGTKTGSEILVTVAVPSPGVTNRGASVAVLTNGTMIVTWSRWDPYAGPNNGEHVYARAFNAATGAPLGAEFRLDTDPDFVFSPSVTALASGGWIATWSSPGADGTHDIKGQAFAANGVKVGAEFLVNTATENVNQGQSSVVALPGGGFVVAWFDHDTVPGESGYWGIRAQIFDDSGAKVGSDFLVNTITDGDQGYFSLDDLPGGGFVVSWADTSRRGGDPHGTAIMAQVFDSAGGKVGTQFLVNTITASDQYNPAVAALASGGFAVAWQNQVSSDLDTDIKLQVFAPSAGAATDIALSTASVSEISLGNYAVGVLSDNGGVNSAKTYTLIADSTGGGFRIEGDRLVVADNRRLDHETAPTASLTVRVTDSNGNSFDEMLSVAIADEYYEQRYTARPEFTAVDGLQGGLIGSAIGSLSAGGFVMAWSDDQNDGGSNVGSVKAQLYDSTGAKVGAAIAVNTTTHNHQVMPSVSGLSGGGFVVVWEDGSLLGGDNSFSGIKGQRFDFAGAKVGGEFLVNTVTEGFQVDAAVTALPSGGFVVTWIDRSDNSHEIKAQIYDSAGARLGGEVIVNTTTAFGFSHGEPAVSGIPIGWYAASGGFVVTWSNAQTGNVHAQIFGATGDKVGGEIQVAASGRWGDSQPTVAVLVSGYFVVAWTSSSGDSGFTSIQAQLFDPFGVRIGSQFLVNTTADFYQTQPTIGALPWGGYVISWQDGSRTGDDLLSDAVRAQVFDMSGNKIGAEFMVNQGVDNAQGSPISTVLASGGFVVGWREEYVEDYATKIGFEGRVFSLTPADNSGHDILVGDLNANVLDGGAGNDQIYGNGGNDDLRGGTGNDWLHVSGSGVVAADGGGDFDYLEVNWGDATTAITMGYPNVDPNGGLIGSIGDGGARRVDYASINIFQLTTGSGNDVLYGGQPGSSASMGGGDDRFWGAGGYETVDGGAGVDGVWAGLGLATSSIVWNLATNSFSGPIGSYTNIEYLLGGVMGSANDTITTSSANLDDRVSLGGGDDVATVLNGQDNINGEFGNDLLIVDYSAATAGIITSGGASGLTLGSDSSGLAGTITDLGSRRVDVNNIDRFDLRTGSGNDVIVLGVGDLVSNDIVSLGGGDDFVDFDRGTDVGDGGAGVDSLAADLSLATVAVSINLLTNSFAGPAGTSFVNFEFLGGSGLRTGTGNDVVVTGQLVRSDIVALGSGADSATVHNGLDSVDGQAGSDLLVIDYSTATAAVTTTGGAVALATDGSGVKGQLGDGGTRRIDFDNVERFDVRTGSGNDIVVLGTGALATSDLVSLGGGDDFADFGRGTDIGDGGSGNDGFAADFTLAGAIAVDLGLNSWSGPAGTSFVNFEYLGSSSSRFLTGGGNDVVVTTAANLGDFVSLGAGNDTATVKNGFDNVDGQAGSDLLVVDYSAATAAVTVTGGIALATGGSGIRGQLGDGGTRRIDFDNVERLDVRTGSGNDSVTLGSLGLSTNDIVSLGGGDDAADFGGGADVGDGGAGVDSLAADLSSASAAVSINLATGSFAGPAGTSFVNFEYFGGSGFQTGQGADNVVSGLLNRNDRVALGAGNDSITLYDGQDTVFGGAAGAGATDSGFDTLVLDYGAATAAVHNIGALQTNGAGSFGQFGDDSTRLATFQAIDRFLIVTGAGNDAIATAGGNDEIRTGGGNDTLAAGAGNDLLDGGAGDDSMSGGTGNDTYVVSSAGDTVVENAGEGADEVRTALASFSLVAAANVENLTATSNVNHDFRGNAGANRIEGGSGNDVLRLYDGGADVVLGGGGDDNIFFIGALDSGDVVNGGGGMDTLVLQGPYGSLVLSPYVFEIENISLLGGNNVNFGEPGSNRYDYVLTTNDANFAAGVQARVNGAALLEGEDFTFNGSAETNASFVVYGGKGIDTLTGGLGNDIFFYAEERFATGDTVNGGAGYDGMFLRGNYTIDFNAPGYTGLFTNIENLTLTSATDERYARGGGTEFDYNLTLSNAIVKPGETLTISGALLMTTETMVLDASQEADGFLRLFGGRASDTLKGGANADLIHGNLGADQLTGNGGADTFRYDSTAESNSGSMDQITDFTPGTDKLDLSRIDANTPAPGDQGFSWIGSNAFSGSAGQLRGYEQGGTWFVEGDVNGDSVADFVLALTLQGPAPLGAGDFLL